MQFTCPVTNFPLPYGYFIHPECAVTLTARMETLAAYMEALHARLHRQFRNGEVSTGAQHPGSSDLLNLSYLEHKFVVENTLAVWTRDLAELAQVPTPGDFREYKRFYETHADLMCRSNVAAQAFDELMHALDYLEQVVENRDERMFAGNCELCSTPEYVRQGRDCAICRNCGNSWTVNIQRAEMMEALRYAWLRPTEATAVASRFCAAPKPSALRQLAARGRIESRGSGPLTRYQPAQIIDHCLAKR